MMALLGKVIMMPRSKTMPMNLSSVAASRKSLKLIRARKVIGHNPTLEDMENPIESPEPADAEYDPDLPGYIDPDKLKDLGNSEDSNYILPVKEEDNLGDEDLIVPEDTLDQEVFRRQLIAIARSLKLKQRQIKAEHDSINERWSEVLAAEEGHDQERR
ncbi:hypothetical protein D1007_33669 [Hordeum vulgare]|nr:hypothetical protein D1007_33669 [Hordeum vulgare]